MTRPLIGITLDNVESNSATGKYESNIAYSRIVTEAGGLPWLLPQEIELAAEYVERCDGLMFTGGDDVRSEMFHIPAHPQSRFIDLGRQTFELALFDALAKVPERPVLGICFGMQLMAMHAGGRMNQHLPDTLPNAVEEHQNNNHHMVVIGSRESAMLSCPAGVIRLSDDELALHTVVSSHHQAVESPGRLRVTAVSADGVIEAIDDPSRPYYVGVQWHPERGQGLLNFDLIQRFVATCASRMRREIPVALK